MSPEEVRAFASENLIYILVFNFILSLFLGIICLIVGIRRGKRNLGIIGLVISIIAGIPSWLFGLISAGVFTTIILVKSKSGKDTGMTIESPSSNCV